MIDTNRLETPAEEDKKRGHAYACNGGERLPGQPGLSPFFVFQKLSRKPNCTSRGWFIADVTMPNVGVPKDVPGSANCTRLNRLKNSVRKSRLMRSVIAVCFTTAK